MISVIHTAKDTSGQTQPIYIMRLECGNASDREKRSELVDYSGLCRRGSMDARSYGWSMIIAVDEALMRGSAICCSASQINHDVLH
jgi:hypothetical protein